MMQRQMGEYQDLLFTLQLLFQPVQLILAYRAVVGHQVLSLFGDSSVPVYQVVLYVYVVLF
jgi:hypothetical protein